MCIVSIIAPLVFCPRCPHKHHIAHACSNILVTQASKIYVDFLRSTKITAAWVIGANEEQVTDYMMHVYIYHNLERDNTDTTLHYKSHNCHALSIQCNLVT